MKAMLVETDEWTRALRAHVEHRSEATLHDGYELGRRALEAGAGIADVTARLTQALEEILRDRGAPGTWLDPVAATGELAAEMLSPFEMAYRGGREANTALRRMNELREEEIRRVAHAIHDAAGQLLATALLVLDREIADPSPAQERVLVELRDLVRQTDSTLRRLLREARPTVLDDLGVSAGLRFLCEGITERTGLRTEVRATLDARPPAEVEIALYRIAQEAITNALKHSKASRIEIQLEDDEKQIRMDVLDDGIGFDPETSRAHHGLGLIGIRERLSALAGSLHVESRPSGGTRVTVTIPRETGVVLSHSSR